METDELYGDDFYENQPFENCPQCGRWYDDIGFDYQFCRACGWDAVNEKWEKPIEPTQSDFECGDADILTGRWY